MNFAKQSAVTNVCGRRIFRNMAGGNEVKHSDRFDLPENMAFTFIIRHHPNLWTIPCGHCAALRSRLPCLRQKKQKIEIKICLKKQLSLSSLMSLSSLKFQLCRDIGDKWDIRDK
ncbi:MAG: hypothetical protein LBC02_13220 [Planctomycetaceae bacterium]|nr:hypothetical protein [Planctomycetaceae bacterium]